MSSSPAAVAAAAPAIETDFRNPRLDEEWSGCPQARRLCNMVSSSCGWMSNCLIEREYCRLKRLGGLSARPPRPAEKRVADLDMQPAVRTEQDRLHNCVGSDVGAYELPRRRTMYLTLASQ